MFMSCYDRHHTAATNHHKQFQQTTTTCRPHFIHIYGFPYEFDMARVIPAEMIVFGWLLAIFRTLCFRLWSIFVADAFIYIHKAEFLPAQQLCTHCQHKKRRDSGSATSQSFLHNGKLARIEKHEIRSIETINSLGTAIENRQQISCCSRVQDRSEPQNV